MDEEPIEILVSMAERGEIDPWNVDIVEVTDRFLYELERLKELDLRISGRTLFYAALLLRMKSEYLEDVDISEEEGDFIEEYDGSGIDIELDSIFDNDDIAEPIERLEREIQRRIGRKRLRKRPVTLYELIKQLKTAEKEERRRHRRKRALPILIEVDDIISLAHEEGYEHAASSVLEFFEKAKQRYDSISLLRLSSEMGQDLRDVYIPLLFLMLEGKLFLSQEEFFGDITVSNGFTELPETD